MNRNQLTLLFVLLALAAGAAFLIYRDKIATWENAGGEGQDILSFEPNEVGEIDITGTTGTVLNLVSKDGTWTVRQRADFPADFDQISALIRTAWDLKPTQAVNVGPSQLPRLELAPPGNGNGAGTLVEFKGNNGKPLASLLLGKKYFKKNADTSLQMNGLPSGRYVMSVDGKNRVFLVSVTLDEFDPNPEKWLSHDFIKVVNVQSISASGTSPAGTWQVARDSVTSIWKLLDPKPGEQIDLTKTSMLAGLFSSPTFTDVLAPGTRLETLGLDKPVTVTITTFDHFNYLLKIGKAIGDNYPVEIQVDARIATERQPGADEKPADKSRLDEAFQNEQKKAQKKLNDEKKFEGRIFMLAKSTLAPVMRDRSHITLPYTAPSPTSSLTPVQK